MTTTRHNWTKEEILEVYNKPMMDLLFEAAAVHRINHDPNVVQVSTLLSIKTGGNARLADNSRNLRGNHQFLLKAMWTLAPHLDRD